MKPKIPLVLTIEERRSPLWRKLNEHFESRLSDLRAQLEGDRTEIETAKLRGRIAEVKLTASLGKDPSKE